jgi:hypothetical protein
VFQDSEVFASFGLAAGLDAQGRPVRLTGETGSRRDRYMRAYFVMD